MKNEEHEESQITTIYIFIGLKLYFARKNILKKSCLYLFTMKFYLVLFTLFSHPVKVTGSMNFGNIFRIMCSSNFSKICTKT